MSNPCTGRRVKEVHVKVVVTRASTSQVVENYTSQYWIGPVDDNSPCAGPEPEPEPEPGPDICIIRPWMCDDGEH